MLSILLLILTPLSYAVDLPVDTKYEQAVKVAIQAAYKQSGYEDKVNTVKNVTTSKFKKLFPLATSVLTLVPIIMYKKVEFRTGNITVTATEDKKEIVWIKSFN